MPASQNVQSEASPLLGDQAAPAKKPFYRARPLWIVPFAVMASLVRGMTIAPRVVVFTQLACTAIHGPIDYNHTTLVGIPSLPSANASNPVLRPSPFPPQAISFTPVDIPFFIPETPRALEISVQRTTTTEKRCLTDPNVQARAARLQSATTTVMGLLSALTTGWWGHAGERIGRTRVLAAAVLGPLFCDFIFLLVTTLPIFTTSKEALPHAEIGLVLASALEGVFGGWTSIQAGTTAYISDCTSPGSRSTIFSRFTGMFFTGFALGPMLAAAVISHGLGPWGQGSVSGVFAVSAIFSATNFLLACFLFPESLPKEKRVSHTPSASTSEESTPVTSEGAGGIIGAIFAPLSVFLPVKVPGQKTADWNLTYLAATFFGYLLAAGIFQIKYLYATHVYEWEAQTLSYYISWVSGFRAFTLLVLLPAVITLFKPSRKPAAGEEMNPAKKPDVSPAQMSRELCFDLALAKASLALEILSHLLVSVIPTSAPAGYFVASTTLSSCGSGLVPSLQSIALSFVNLRASAAAANGETTTTQSRVTPGAGQLLGALAVLHAAGQMILGPVIFGAIFSATVATFPKAIFATAAGISFVAVMFLFMVRPTRNPSKRKQRHEAEQERRGRSRVSKDLGRRSSDGQANFLSDPNDFGPSTNVGSSGYGSLPLAGSSASSRA